MVRFRESVEALAGKENDAAADVYKNKANTIIIARVVIIIAFPLSRCQRVVTSDAHTSAAASGPARWTTVDWRHAFRCWD